MLVPSSRRRPGPRLALDTGLRRYDDDTPKRVNYVYDAAMTEQSANPHWGSTLDDFPDEEGIREEATTAAIKQSIARQLAGEKRRNVTIETLQCASALLGRQLRLVLV